MGVAQRYVLNEENKCKRSAGNVMMLLCAITVPSLLCPCPKFLNLWCVHLHKLDDDVHSQ